MTLNQAKTRAKGLLRYCLSLASYITGQHKYTNKGQIIVLMYHRIMADNDAYSSFIQPGMYVRQSSFRKQLELLKDNYEIISVTELLSISKGSQLDKNKQYCVITFDDGWRDNYQYAFPILKELAIPATIFLAESYIGANRLFWHEKLSFLFYHSQKKKMPAKIPRFTEPDQKNEILIQLKQHLYSENINTSTIDSAIEYLKKFTNKQIEDAINTLANDLNFSFDDTRTMLNWDEVTEMGESGVSFGSHTCEHKILTNIPIEEATKEIVQSSEKLKNRGLNYVPVFCYPNGRYNSEIREQVIKAGYEAAVSTKLGRESYVLDDQFGIKRIGVHDDITYNKPLFAYRIR